MEAPENVFICSPDIEEQIEELPEKRKEFVKSFYEFLVSVPASDIVTILANITDVFERVKKDIVTYTDFTMLINWLSFDYYKKAQNESDPFYKLSQIYAIIWELFDNSTNYLFNENEQKYYYKITRL